MFERAGDSPGGCVHEGREGALACLPKAQAAARVDVPTAPQVSFM